MRRLSIIVAVLCISLCMVAQPRYDYSKIQLERLGRGLVAVPQESGDTIMLSWRLMDAEDLKTAYDIYRDGVKLNRKPVTATYYKDVYKPTADVTYEVRAVNVADAVASPSGTYTMRQASPRGYIGIKLDKPQGGVTPDGQRYGYTANDASVGDVDGDGEYEIILKWEPTNAHDNSHEGYTGNVFFDCYRLDGRRLWRIDMGRNIRAGAHYTQFMVYDLDGDGKAELVMKTADGTVDGLGTCIGDSSADYRTNGFIEKSIENKQEPKRSYVKGRILEGPEYLTVFEGQTGRAMATVDYLPSRGNPSDWGDSYGNRCDRFLACIAYLDGVHPSVVMCRGYYTRTVLVAWDWDGKSLERRWTFDTNDEPWRGYAGQGNHNLRVGDVDGDGMDEITYGSMAVDHDGTGLYNTRMGHGDALHQMAFYPDSATLQVWDVHENRRDGSDFRDARTGRVIFQIPSGEDVGRGMAADIDPTNYGVEMWSITSTGYYDVKGQKHAEGARIPVNSAVWWDGDLLRELLDRNAISKYDYRKCKCEVIKDFGTDCSFNNGSKSNPCLSADIIGDWREEVIVRTRANDELRIYVTDMPTAYRFHTFMHDVPYRISVATENVSYNQPPELGFYLK